MSTRRQHADRAPAGQAVVEFALVAPILVLMLAGLVDLGNGYTTYIALSNGAREEAAFGAYPTDGSTYPSGSHTTCPHATQALPSGLQSATCLVTYPSVPGCTTGTRVARCPIRVTLTYALTTLVGSVIGVNSFNISPTVDMMVLQ